MVKRFVHVWPLSIVCQIGAFAPQLPLKALMTISLELAGLMAMVVSPSLKVSVFLRLGSVLLTTVSTILMRFTTAPGPVSVTGGAPPTSSGIAGRAYGVVSF